MTLTFKHNLDSVKMNQLAKYLPRMAPVLLCALMYLLILALYKLFVCLLPDLSTLSKIDAFRFQAVGRRRQPNLAFVLIFSFIYCHGCMLVFVVFVFVFQY